MERKVTTMNEKVLKALVKVSGATKKYKPFTYGNMVRIPDLELNGTTICCVEVWKDKAYFMSSEYDGYHIIETHNTLSDECCQMILDKIQSL